MASGSAATASFSWCSSRATAAIHRTTSSGATTTTRIAHAGLQTACRSEPRAAPRACGARACSLRCGAGAFATSAGRALVAAARRERVADGVAHLLVGLFFEQRLQRGAHVGIDVDADAPERLGAGDADARILV